MQQRQLRLGDVLDDYCPRERRITNHAIVAIVGQEVRQTRCVTCEAEHEYKQAKVPPQRRKPPAPGALYQDVLGGMPKPVTAGSRAAQPDEPETQHDEVPDAASEASLPAASDENEEGPVHRPLIRATLPRQEGQVPARPIPDFTIRQPAARPGRFKTNGKPRRGGGHQSPGFAGQGHGFGARRGAQSGPPSARPAHGNRARPAHGDRPGPSRRRGGKKRPK